MFVPSSETRQGYSTVVDKGRIGAISFLYIFVFLGYASFVIVNMIDTDPSLALKYERFLLLSVVGILFHFIGVVFAHDETHYPSMRSVAVGVGIFVAVGVIAMMIKWGYAFYPFAEDLSKTDKIMFYQTAAVSEEIFFCFGVFSMLVNVMQTPFAHFTASIITGIMFSIFHLAVYGVSKGVMLLLFIGRVLMCLGYYYTQRLDTAIIAHSMINLAASLGV